MNKNDVASLAINLDVSGITAATAALDNMARAAKDVCESLQVLTNLSVGMHKESVNIAIGNLFAAHMNRINEALKAAPKQSGQTD